MRTDVSILVKGDRLILEDRRGLWRNVLPIFVILTRRSLFM